MNEIGYHRQMAMEQAKEKIPLIQLLQANHKETLMLRDQLSMFLNKLNPSPANVVQDSNSPAFPIHQLCMETSGCLQHCRKMIEEIQISLFGGS